MKDAIKRHLRQKIRPATALMTLVAVLLAVGASQLSLLRGLEQDAEDYRQRERILQYGGVRLPAHKVRQLNEAGKDEPDPDDNPARFAEMWDVCLVTMDESSIRRRDGMPFSPNEHARVIETLAKLGATVVVFDMLYSERREKHFPGGIGELLATIERVHQEHGVRTVFAWKYEFDRTGEFRRFDPLPEIEAVADEGSINLPISGLTGSARAYRFVHEPPKADQRDPDADADSGSNADGASGSDDDADGAEQDSAGAGDDAQDTPPLSLGMVALALHRYPSMTAEEAYARLIADHQDDPVVQAYFAEPTTWQLNYYGPAGTFPRASYADLYDAYDALDESELAAIDADIAKREGEADEEAAILLRAVPALKAPLENLRHVLRNSLDDDEAIIAAEDAAIAVLEERAPEELRDTLMTHLDNFILLTEVAAEDRLERAEIKARLQASVTPEERALVAKLRHLVQGKIALIGPWALDFQDLYVTPTRGLPPVEWGEWPAEFQPEAFHDNAADTVTADTGATADDARNDDDGDDDGDDGGTGDGGTSAAPTNAASDDADATPTPPGEAPQTGGKIDTTRMYGVEIHATAIQNGFEMISRNTPDERRGIRHPAEWLQIAIVAGIALLAAIIAIAFPPVWGIGFALIGTVGYLALARHAFLEDAMMLPVVGPVIGGIISYGLLEITKLLTIDRERRQVDRLFKNYVDRRFVELLKRDPNKVNLGGERKEITVFFSDVAGFSGISEKLEPEDLVTLLNEYLGAMTDIILAHDGTIDKYIGDAIMAFWNAPIDVADHALLACKAALKQRELLRTLQRRWGERGFPRVDARMGLHTGPVVHANVGSNLRKNYTLMGDNVNLAARFEPLNKDFGTAIIIGERTAELAGGGIVTRQLGEVQVKGRTRSVRFFELVGLPDEVDAELRRTMQLFEDALGHYTKGAFEDAEQGFEKVLERRRADGPAMTYLALTKKYLAEPPKKEGWTGVFEQKSK